MKKFRNYLFTFFIMTFFIPYPGYSSDYLARADKLDDERTIENYAESIELCTKVLAEKPEDYEANWKCARSYFWYGELSKQAGVKDWKDICEKSGKKGMELSKKAIDIAPDKPDGHFWYAFNAALYSDGVSLVTAMREGLKNQTQESIEKVYEIDKMYKKGRVLLFLGRFWASLPWPLKDKKASLKYYREYQETEYFGEIPEGPIYLAELLVDMGGKKKKAEAKLLLETKVSTDTPYYLKLKNSLLEKLD